MSRRVPAVTAITAGTRLVYDGEAWTVGGIEGGRLLLTGRPGQRPCWRTPRRLLADPRPACRRGRGEPPARGPLLDSLPTAERGRAGSAAAHVREVLTGYRSGRPRAGGAGRAAAGVRPGCRCWTGTRRRPPSWA